MSDEYPICPECGKPLIGIHFHVSDDKVGGLTYWNGKERVKLDE